MKQLCFYAIVCLLMLIMGCNKANNTVSNDKIYSYKQQHWKSNQITQFVNDISYTATEVPLKYYILKHIDNNTTTNVDSIVKTNERERVIEVEFQHIDKLDLLDSKFTNKDYENGIKYMAFSIENDFTIVTSSNDTIKCAGAHFERNFKVAPFKRALLYFNNINPDDNIKLIYQDHLFGNGVMEFNFIDVPIKL